MKNSEIRSPMDGLLMGGSMLERSCIVNEHKTPLGEFSGVAAASLLLVEVEAIHVVWWCINGVRYD
jgi:hypothetical protein